MPRAPGPPSKIVTVRLRTAHLEALDRLRGPGQTRSDQVHEALLEWIQRQDLEAGWTDLHFAQVYAGSDPEPVPAFVCQPGHDVRVQTRKTPEAKP